MEDGMSEEQGGARDGTEPNVQVRDRRRFDANGDPVVKEEREEAAAPSGSASEQPDPRDEKLAQQEARIDELTRAYAALVEEGKAARGRMERERARVLDADRAQLAQALLEGVDHLHRALSAAGDSTGPLVEGVRLTLGVLEKKVQELGATRIQVLGERFDPRWAEAVDIVAVADPAQDDVVVQEIQAGYRIGDRVLRPARVRVGRLARA
jgi:molecular chaperone GrpE